MTTYQLICVFGIPSIIGAAILALIKYLLSDNKRKNEEIKALKKGIQALLRAQMVNEFKSWSEKGFAPIYARQNFENCWQQYHTLGANGVMDDIHNKFFELPTNPPEGA